MSGHGHGPNPLDALRKPAGRPNETEEGEFQKIVDETVMKIDKELADIMNETERQVIERVLNHVQHHHHGHPQIHRLRDEVNKRLKNR